jgi:sugar porter (SP) family MFS transporter
MNEAQQINQRYLLMLLIIIGGVTFGYNISIIASALPKIRSEFLASDKTLSLIAGLVFAGVTAAKVFIGILNDTLGRRRTFIYSGFLFILGTLLLLLAHNITMVIVGRIVQGMGGGLMMFTMPLYIVEIAHEDRRAQLMALYQLSFTIGLLLANIVGMLFFNINWKLTFLILVFLTVCFLVLAYSLPCSPRWLYRNGYALKARMALLVEHTQDEVIALLQAWTDNSSVTEKTGLIKYRYLKPVLIVILVTCLNQLTGINAILQLSTILLQQTGVPGNFSLWGSSAITLVNVLGTMVGLKIINKFARNKLLGWCAILIAGAHFISGLSFYLHSNLLLFLGLTLFILTYAIGPGIIIWLVFSEYLPMPIRAQGLAIAGFINSLTGFVISALFLGLSHSYGFGAVFLSCSLFSILYGVIPLLFLPDTNGKRLEEIENLFNKASK